MDDPTSKALEFAPPPLPVQQASPMGSGPPVAAAPPLAAANPLQLAAAPEKTLTDFKAKLQRMLNSAEGDKDLEKIRTLMEKHGLDSTLVPDLRE
jgi:hypothetical protein